MWELLYETFWDRLEHFCFNLCRDEARAEDLTQEVFLRALQNRTLINSFTERQCNAWALPAGARWKLAWDALRHYPGSIDGRALATLLFKKPLKKENGK